MASSSMIPSKVTLRSTSKIPLSDRFKMVRQKALIQSNIEPVSVRPAVKPTVQVSKKNRLLAQAMANKPSVLAALKIKRKSIKQRLGVVRTRPVRGAPALRRSSFPSRKSNISERLQVPSTSSGGGRGRPRLNRNNFVGTTKLTPKNVRRIGRNQGGNVLATNSANRRPRLNRSANQANQLKPKNAALNNKAVNNANFRRNPQQKFKQRFDSRGVARNRNQKGFQQQQQPQNRNFKGRNAQGKQGGSARGFKGGPDQRFKKAKKRFQNRWQRQGQMQRKNVDKGQLDKDLDAYMAKTKNHLDADLDAYMAGV